MAHDRAGGFRERLGGGAVDRNVEFWERVVSDIRIFDPFRRAGMLCFGYGETEPWANRRSHSLRYSSYVRCAGRRCDKTRQMGVFGGCVRTEGTARGGIQGKRLSA
jgi:hypothetical protein